MSGVSGADAPGGGSHLESNEGTSMREVTIRSVYGDVLYVAKGAADVRAAVEKAARNGADLRSANLRFANLGSADLRYADLGFAKGVSPERSNELLLLREQVGKIRAYKLVTADLKSPIHSENPITYEIGSTVQAEADTNEAKDCGAGINLATLPWCLNEHRDGRRILVCEFTAKDIAAIPNADGKFRVHKAKVVKELDLTEMFEREARDRAEFGKAWAGRKAAA